MRKYLFFVFYLSLSSSYSQEIYHRIINSDNGLPSNKVHYVYEDSRGYIWFGTENGVCRWDSKNFKTYTIKDGLPNNEVIYILEDSKGRIWFSTFSNELCYLRNDTIYNAKKDKRLKKISIVKGGKLMEYKGEIYYIKKADSVEGDLCYHFNLSSLAKTQTNIAPPTMGNPDLVFHNNNNLVLYSNPRYSPSTFNYKSEVFQFNKVKIELDNNSSLSLIDYNTSKYYLLEINSLDSFFHTYCRDPVTYKESQIAYLKGIKSKKTINLEKEYRKYTPNNIESTEGCKIYHKNKFYGNLMQFYFLKNDTIEIYSDKVSILHKGSFDLIYELSYSQVINNKLFTLTNNDVKFLPNTTIINFNQPNSPKSPIHKLVKLGSTIHSIHENEIMYSIATKQKRKLLVDRKMYHIGHGENSRIFLTSYRKIIDIQTGKNLTENFLPQFSRFKGFSYSEKHKLYTINNSFDGLFILDLNHKTQKISDAEAYTSFIDSRDRLWYGTINKLYVTQKFLPKVQKEKEFVLNPLFETFCAEIKEDNRGNIFFTTNDGVYILDKQNRKYHLYDKNLLSSNECKTLVLDTAQQCFIVATRFGVNQIHYREQGGKLTFEVVNKFFKDDGLQSNEINDILLDGDSLWVATAKGLNLILNKNYRPDRITIPIHINEFFVNNQSIPLDSHYVLRHDQNNLKIDFSTIYYHRRDRLDIKYRLIHGNDTTENSLSDNFINLTSLANGDYTLEIYAYDKDYPYVNSRYKKLSIKITPPYYKTWWFISLIFISLLGIMAIFLWYRNKLKLDKLKAESELHRLTLHGLQNQMNPHFVFNVLNTLQHFILRKEKEHSLNFLSDFSSLIRKILDNSREELISLEEELIFLRQYSDIELERYGHKFTIEFDNEVDEDELTDIRIPPMLIQPLIENAIKHGVSNQDSGGKIVVKLRLAKEDLLYVSVSDNGRGIDKKSSSSKAIKILEERLALIKNKQHIGSFELIRKEDKTYSILNIPI